MMRLSFFIAGLALLILALAASSGVAQASESAKADAPPIYVPVAPITVPMMRAGYIQGSFHIKLDIAVATKSNEEKVSHLMPRLEAAYMGNLTDLAQYYIRADKPADLKLIGKVLQQTTDRILGSGEARLLINDTAIHR